MPRKTGDENELTPYTFNIPRCHLEAIREEAIEQSSPKKQVKPAEVARSIFAEWYENKTKQTSHA